MQEDAGRGGGRHEDAAGAIRDGAGNVRGGGGGRRDDQGRGPGGRRADTRGRRVAVGEGGGVGEEEVRPAVAGRNPEAVGPGHHGRVDEARQVIGRRSRIVGQHLDLHQLRRPVAVLLQLRNPDRLARQVLAGEDTQATRRLARRPAEDVEARLPGAAARQLDRTAEMDRPDRVDAACPQLGCAGRGVVGREGGPLEPSRSSRKAMVGRRCSVAVSTPRSSI